MVMDSRTQKKECKYWQRQNCTNCQYLNREATDFYYRTNHKLWHVGRGNPTTGENCEECDLRSYGRVKELISQVKRDASDIYENIGCLEVQKVVLAKDLVSALDLISDNIRSSASRAGLLGLKARDLEKPDTNFSYVEHADIESIMLLQNEEKQKVGYEL